MDISDATKVLKWNKRLLDVLGLWPLNLNEVKFSFFFIYITVQCFLQYADLAEYIYDFNYVVRNLTETIVLSMIFLKIFIYRIISNELRELIQYIQEDYSEIVYSTANEIKTFLQYTLLSKRIVQCLLITCGFTTVLFYMQPLTTQLLAYNEGNSSTSFILPFHIRLFFDVTQARIYYIIYACEIFVVPLVLCGFIGTDCLLITLVLHICGQISILTMQVGILLDDPRNLREKLKRIVIRHCRLLRLFANLQSAYSAFLLQELFGITFLMCLGSYNVIATSAVTDSSNFIRFLFYILTLIFQLFGMCYIGECVTTESSCLCNAFYNCEWYNISPDHAKSFLMCILRSQKPLTLTAGNFFTFSLVNFTSVVRTSIGYLSVMRKFL
ncbi:Odorant receptor 20 [Cephus cinctus]|uniref:Odorant receptor n=1 Tax=Cephus cinctus TaxID=211228 RepID=A0A1W6L1J1_CEPCN|nr:odorant receptor 4 [Cephus cinctus]ARN17903.1 odorant receptor 32 [Cephus cinctus]RLZ02270.1 Odorant receptor 20 [Cephus cinctus]